MITYKIYSNIGNREVNEDSVGEQQKDENYLFILADGLGGHGHGECASNLALIVYKTQCSSGFSIDPKHQTPVAPKFEAEAKDAQRADKKLWSLFIDGKEVKLTATEFNILKFLLKNKGKVYSITQIYENVWNEESYGAENIIAVHIRHIREKIEINPKEPRYLKVIWGIGYKIEKID